MAKATIKFLDEKKRRIILPKEVVEVEDLHEGDYMEIDVKKVAGWECSRIIITENNKNFVELNPKATPDAIIVIKPEALSQRLRTFDVKGYNMKMVFMYADRTELPDDAEVTLYIEDIFLQNRSGKLYMANHSALKQGVLFNKQIELDDRHALIVCVEGNNREIIHPKYIKLEIEMDFCYKR